jgi:hypothetical protein
MHDNTPAPTLPKLVRASAGQHVKLTTLTAECHRFSPHLYPAAPTQMLCLLLLPHFP